MSSSGNKKLEASEAHLFSSVDQNASQTVNLIGLPFVCKLLVFRYLDLKSLSKIRQTSRLVNTFVKSHRHRLVSFVVVELLRMIQDNHSTQINTYQVHLSNDEDSSFIELPYNCVPELQWTFELDSGRQSFFEWLTDNFCNTLIGTLNMVDMSFRDEDLDKLEKLMKKRKFCVKEIVLTDVVFSTTPAESMVRFLKLISKDLEWLEVQCDGVDQLFLTSEFFDLLPALQSLDCSKTHPINEELVTIAPVFPTLHKLPRTFYLETDMIFPFETLKRAIHSWWRDEGEVDCWQMNLSIAYADRELFAKSVDLPYTISNGYVVFRKTDGSVLTAHPTTSRKHFSPNQLPFLILNKKILGDFLLPNAFVMIDSEFRD